MKDVCACTRDLQRDWLHLPITGVSKLFFLQGPHTEKSDGARATLLSTPKSVNQEVLSCFYITVLFCFGKTTTWTAFYKANSSGFYKILRWWRTSNPRENIRLCTDQQPDLISPRRTKTGAICRKTTIFKAVSWESFTWHFHNLGLDTEQKVKEAIFACENNCLYSPQCYEEKPRYLFILCAFRKAIQYIK